ncbi:MULTISPECIES: HD domain-containing phosphohydrolase [unclassified Neptuniibacter]|uniref:HD domain-containing phosphohydrolase n=1 Tax=unclassified Neptuniibacter TaxID=2630693 RepID=UPI000C671D87|nr:MULTISPECIES: HD domain-containing phosphohydrolase [unclassified Neptuniibacter]MAY42172.1 metal-dependent phosphohydrolase [Oceanospirillaceae bacterium]|tara:strand:- start:20046 stop:21638 length:1593 start_codon:yes stop_codon:yes gene_type:complete
MSHLDTQEIVKQLADLTGALTSEKDHTKLLDRIILGCMYLTNADGGTLYTLNEENENELAFTILHNRSLGIHRKPRDLPPIQLFNSQQQASKLVVVQTFVQRETINIPDAYSCTDYDFSGTRNFDKQLSYQSKSFLCVPLQDHEGEIIGVLQLINAIDADGEIITFPETQQHLVESLASLAAAVLTKRRLIDAQRLLFESFIKLIGRAIDHKSPVTGKHCEQVPEIAMLLAGAVNKTDQGKFADMHFNDLDMYELKIAAWLHDCGKITTPEYIIDKATKLHTMYDRIDLVESRFREYKQHLEIEYLKQYALQNNEHQKQAHEHLTEQQRQLDNDFDFIRRSNTGSEFMSDEDTARIISIAETSWIDAENNLRQLLTKDEVDNLCIRKGTLTEDERQVMRDHIKVSIDMLESLNYPKQLQQVPEIACNHHEHMDGSGYPRGLKAEDLSTRARIMCIADIFEALTSPDRPYKKGMLLSQAMTILGRMVEDNHLDSDLFRLFVESGTYLNYAQTHMTPRQIDEFDITTLPGLN